MRASDSIIEFYLYAGTSRRVGSGRTVRGENATVPRKNKMPGNADRMEPSNVFFKCSRIKLYLHNVDNKCHVSLFIFFSNNIIIIIISLFRFHVRPLSPGFFFGSDETLSHREMHEVRCAAIITR